MQRNGFTLVEIMISVVLMCGTLMLGFYFFSQANENMAISTNAGIRVQVEKNFNQIINFTTKGPTQRAFDPAKTLIFSGSTYSYAGTWQVDVINTATDPPTTNTVTQTTAQTLQFNVIVPPPTVGTDTTTCTSTGTATATSTDTSITVTTLVQDSHLLNAYKIHVDVCNQTIKTPLYAVYSRCVDARDATVITTRAQIEALRFPMIIDKKLYCCTDRVNCPDAGDPESSQPYYFPTMFMYRSDGLVAALPSNEERDIMPGVGFYVYFDAAHNPRTITFRGFEIENQCKLTRINFASRSLKDCAKTKIPVNSTLLHFDTDLHFKEIYNRPMPAGSDANGSGYNQI